MEETTCHALTARKPRIRITCMRSLTRVTGVTPPPPHLMAVVQVKGHSPISTREVRLRVTFTTPMCSTLMKRVPRRMGGREVPGFEFGEAEMSCTRHWRITMVQWLLLTMRHWLRC
uniref:Uncharacterized protein n=1 Tax=Cacopsylla melanoneura TaxID=428564 RepID=A0A8D8V2W1_9HEMI